MNDYTNSKPIEEEIFDLVSTYYKLHHFKKEFIPGKTYVPVSGKVYDEAEITNLVSAALDFNLTEGVFANTFRKKLQEVTGRRYAVLCNSGSSANLLAITALAKKGGKALTPVVGFPTTLNPILQNNMTPIFIDVELETYVPSYYDVMEACDKYKPELVVLAHTLGNPAQPSHPDIPLILDSCDALGSKWDYVPITKYGNISTLSFYPAHHITTGEGGAVLTDDPKLKLKLDSLCGWGRNCYCSPGKDNTCGKRFSHTYDKLPFGYDHKYVYTEIGYNLKMTDMQASVGIPQLDKLPSFVEARKNNFTFFYNFFKKYEEFFHLPRATEHSDPAWFGFPLTIRKGVNIDRLDLLQYLEDCRIGTRLLFGGNLLRQPAYKDLTYIGKSEFPNADLITTNTFWIGVYPGITETMREYVAMMFEKYMKGV